MGFKLVVGAVLATRIAIDLGRLVAPRLIRNVHHASSIEDAVRMIRQQGQDEPANRR
ncbi:MAG: hypothetical protein ACOCX5_02335 [Chloroflexota bacterium]